MRKVRQLRLPAKKIDPEASLDAIIARAARLDRACNDLFTRSR
jgi:hypothetical protein